MTSLDDWLNDEQFDFDVTASPVGDQGDALLVSGVNVDNEADEDEDDEEVFFGPQTFKEKCTAVVVTEQEVNTTPVEILNPEQQALILRESALLSIRIRQGTPNSITTKGSPIAVVHPMLRETSSSTTSTTASSNDKNLKSKGTLAKPTISTDINKENVGPPLANRQKQTASVPPKRHMTPSKSKLSSSKLLQPKFSTNKNRPSSQPDPSTTKLPVSKSRGKLQSEFSEPLVDKMSLYGLHKTQPKGGIARRRSGVSLNNQALSDSSIMKTKTTKAGGSQPPAMLQSAIPSSRLKAPPSTSSKISSTSDLINKSKSGLHPMRIPAGPTLASGSSGVPRSNIRLASTGGGPRKTASTATPSKLGKPSGVISSKRRSIAGGDTPSRKSAATVERSSSVAQSSNQDLMHGRKNNMVTPVQRTPSTRKSMPARQLIARRSDSSRTPSPAHVVSSSGHSQENNVTLTENAPRCLHNASTNNNIQSEQAVNPVPECEPAVTTEASASAAPYAHLDILNRYKKLCAATGNKVRPNLAADVTSGKCGSSDQTTTRTVSSLPSDASQEYETPGPAVVTSVREVNKHLHIKEAPLVDIYTASPLLKMSPVKTKDMFLDPFHTGATPPPLIDVVDVLEPERPSEMNLIEF